MNVNEDALKNIKLKISFPYLNPALYPSYLPCKDMLEINKR